MLVGAFWPNGKDERSIEAPCSSRRATSTAGESPGGGPLLAPEVVSQPEPARVCSFGHFPGRFPEKIRVSKCEGARGAATELAPPRGVRRVMSEASNRDRPRRRAGRASLPSQRRGVTLSRYEVLLDHGDLLVVGGLRAARLLGLDLRLAPIPGRTTANRMRAGHDLRHLHARPGVRLVQRGRRWLLRERSGRVRRLQSVRMDLGAGRMPCGPGHERWRKPC
jgi:hypothetical protein